MLVYQRVSLFVDHKWVLKSIHRSGRNHGIIGAVRATHQVGHVQQEVSLVKALKRASPSIIGMRDLYSLY